MSDLAAFFDSALVPRWHRDGNLEAAQASLRTNPGHGEGDVWTAALTGDADAVRRFLEGDAGLARREGGPRSWPPLLYAMYSRFFRDDQSARPGFREIVRLLLEHGADPNAFWLEERDDPPSKEAALYGACGIANDVEATRLLLEAGADPNDGESAYHAVEFDDMRCAALLFAHGLDRDNRATALLHKLDYDDLDGVAVLLEAGADPNAVTFWQKTALHQAISRGRALAFLELLVEAGGDASIPNGEGKTAYVLAARHGRSDVTALFESGGHSEVLTGLDRFVAACAAGDGDVARRMLQEDPGLLDRLNADDRAAIVDAARGGRSEAVELMLSLGWEVDAPGLLGATALHWAGWFGHTAVVDVLLARGAALDRRDTNYGIEPLAWAVDGSRRCGPSEGGGGHLEIVHRLVAAGAVIHEVMLTDGSDAVNHFLRGHTAR